MTNNVYKEAILVLFLLAIAPILVAGNDLTTYHGGQHSKNVHHEIELLIPPSYSNVKDTIKTRDNIWKMTILTKEKRQKKILKEYENALPLLKEASDFIDLLKNTTHLAPTTDNFINAHMDILIATNLSFEQIGRFDSILCEVPTRIALKTKALPLVREASDFIKLVTISPDASKCYKKSITDFIREHLSQFKAAKPSISEVNTIQKYLIKIQVDSDIEKTVDALIDLKKLFINDFNGLELLTLLGYQCERPIKSYENKLSLLIKQNPFLTTNIYSNKEEMIKARDRIVNKKKTSTINRDMSIRTTYEVALPLLQSPWDFIELFQAYDGALKGVADEFFVAHHEDFFATNPSITQTLLLDSLAKTIACSMHVKLGGLKVVQSPDDFLLLARRIGDNPGKDYKVKITNFIRDNISVFAKTKPSIDQIMELHQILFTLQVDSEKTTAVLLALKEAFIANFTGTELIRLLDFACEKPSASYERQVSALKKMHKIEF